MQLLNNFLLIHLHTYGPKPSGMTVHAVMGVHTQLPGLSRAVPMAEGTFANQHLQAWLIITEKLRTVHSLYWEKKQWPEKERDLKEIASLPTAVIGNTRTESNRYLLGTYFHVSQKLHKFENKINYWLLKTDSTICFRAPENFSISIIIHKIIVFSNMKKTLLFCLWI